LAQTLKLIQKQGQKAFYEGKNAQLLVSEMKRGNGIITLEDLKNYKTKERKALEFDYKNHEILDNAGDLYTAMGWAVARGKGRPCKDYETSKRVFSCCAGAAIYRMDIMRKIGGLDEKHFAYLEDVDLGYRARIAGFENWYIPEAKVYHVGSATTGTRYNKKKVFLAARNTIFVIYKNMPVLQLALNVPFIFIGMFIKTLFFVRKGFGEDYCKGILEGIYDCKKCWKVKFRMKNLSNYFKIQLELWRNLVRII
jgi:hypothetical protein